MNFTDKVIRKAQVLKNTVLVLPESTDARTLQATQQILELDICSHIILLGNKDIILKHAKNICLSLSNKISILDPATDTRKDDFVGQYYEKRKHKGLSEVQALKDMSTPLFFGTMLVHNKEATGMVAGAITTTANVLRPAIRIIGTAANTKVVSSCFIMESHITDIGHQGLFIFSDCGIVPKPNSEELATITVSAAQSCRDFLDTEPIVSLLSFSTLGSAEHEDISIVRNAVSIIRQQHPNLCVDGELQMDAAINKTTASIKAPNSPSAGKSNTLIFPNLAAGNIGYKTAQQFGKTRAYGPIIQGLAAPINDLSRGCVVEEIVTTAAITLCQGSGGASQ